MSFDVSIVGGGLAGMHIAGNLSLLDLSVALVEARHVYGGRVRVGTIRREVVGDGCDYGDDGGTMGEASLGGTWIGKTHSRMLDLLRAVGMDVEKPYFPPPCKGEKEREWGGGSFSRLVSLLSYEPRPLDDDEHGEMEDFVALLNDIVNSVDVSDVSSLHDVVVYDYLSIDEFVFTRVRSEAIGHK